MFLSSTVSQGCTFDQDGACTPNLHLPQGQAVGIMEPVVHDRTFQCVLGEKTWNLKENKYTLELHFHPISEPARPSTHKATADRLWTDLQAFQYSIEHPEKTQALTRRTCKNAHKRQQKATVQTTFHHIANLCWGTFLVYVQ